MIYTVVILVSFVAVFVNSITGFGFGILSVIAFSFVMPASSAIYLTSILSVIMCGMLARLHVKHIQWRLLVLPTSFSLAAGFLCIHFAASLPETIIKRMLGAFLLLLSLYFIFFNSHVKIKGTLLNGAAMGALSGTFTGLFSIGGPLIVIYYLLCMDNKNHYMATSQIHFLIITASMLIMRVFYNQITIESLKLSGAALIPILLAAYFGTKLFKSLNEKKVRNVIYLFMAICGSYFLIIG